MPAITQKRRSSRKISTAVARRFFGSGRTPRIGSLRRRNPIGGTPPGRSRVRRRQSYTAPSRTPVRNDHR